jgi:prolipoprotein diacylglyceryltransferase
MACIASILDIFTVFIFKAKWYAMAFVGTYFIASWLSQQIMKQTLDLKRADLFLGWRIVKVRNVQANFMEGVG